MIEMVDIGKWKFNYSLFCWIHTDTQQHVTPEQLQIANFVRMFGLNHQPSEYYLNEIARSYESG